MEVDTPTLASVLTIAGAATAAGLIFVFVEVLKTWIPAIGERHLEQSVALAAALALVIFASIDRHMATGVTTMNDAFTSFIAWLAIAKLATGIHDEVERAPGSFREQATA